MAALQYTAANTTSLRRHGHRTTTSTLNNLKNPTSLIFCIQASFPTKPTKRKNYLRQKILKTLPKSPVPQLPTTSPIELEIIKKVQELGDFDNNKEAANDEGEKNQEFKEVEVSLPNGVGGKGNVGFLAKNPILKYGLWLFGAFVFQTVCAVWVFGSADFDDKSKSLDENEKSSVLDLSGNGKIGSYADVDELEMARKVEEIRVLAREVREMERLESRKGGLGSGESDGIKEMKYSRSGIEEEVDNRLVKLKNTLENVRENKPAASVGLSRKGELDRSLLYKKKYKFKGNDIREKPKGFASLDDSSITKTTRSGNLDKNEDKPFGSLNGGKDAISLRNHEDQSKLSDVTSGGSEAVNGVEDGRLEGIAKVTASTKSSREKVMGERGKQKQVTGSAIAKPTISNGVAQEKSDGKSVMEAVESRRLNTGNLTTSESSDMNIVVVSNELSKGNGSLKGKGDGAAKVAKSKIEADFWWLSLPYVLGILMRRGQNGEGGGGLYTLKSRSKLESHISHTVAFEDRVDAANFCYLLQSFFQDLEDFEADVVPLTTKELNEEVKSQRKKVIVVKKGQLQLYAGQPLSDAEMALRALLKQV